MSQDPQETETTFDCPDCCGMGKICECCREPAPYCTCSAESDYSIFYDEIDCPKCEGAGELFGFDAEEEIRDRRESWEEDQQD